MDQPTRPDVFHRPPRTLNTTLVTPDVLHVDLDAFYASVEQLLNPDLRGKPIAVGGGVVMAASYEARAFGVRSGMPGSRARLLCPDLISVDGHFSEYSRLSGEVFAICDDFTPIVEKISIDEAFLDVSGSRHLLGKPGVIGREIRDRVLGETGLPISVGVARTKFLAKIASQVAKPDGMIVVPVRHELDFLHPLPVRLMWGVGPVTQAKLAEYGVETIGDLAGLPQSTLGGRLGRGIARHLSALSWNRDPRGVRPGHRAKSVSSQSGFGRHPIDQLFINRILHDLADRVASRLRDKDRAGKTITVRIRFGDMTSITRSVTLGAAVASTEGLYDAALDLVATGLGDHPEHDEISLLSVGTSGLTYGSALQLELPLVFDDTPLRPGSELGRKHHDLDRAVDTVRERFGRNAAGHAAAKLSPDRQSAPDEFRELAQKN